MELTLNQINKITGGKLHGNGELVISGVSSIDNSKEGDITFIKNEEYVNKVFSTNASAVVVHRLIEKSEKPLIIVDHPFLEFTKILQYVSSQKLSRPKIIHPSAVIADSVSIGKNGSIGANVVIEENTSIGDNVIIYPNVFIGKDCKIGDNSVIYPAVVIREEVIIGKRAIIHSGTTIGDDGFGFLQVKGKHVKIPQVGTVEIGDDVEIGSKVTVARAALDKTIISNGVKIDNHSHVAHNVFIGENSMLVGYAKLAGGVKLGKNVIIAEGAGVSDHVEIGDNCIVGGGSSVYKSLKPGSVVWGSPAKPINKEKRIQVIIKKLPEIYKKTRKLP